MRIGVYGGSFDPLHMGHIEIARAVKRELELDRLLFVVASDPPHKRIAGVVSAKVRYEMTCAGLAGEDGLSASDIELRRGGVSYTADTLQKLKAELPNDELFFILGADMLGSFKSWYKPEIIMSCASLAAVQREGMREELSKLAAEIEEQFGGRVIVTGVVGRELSSTEIRQRVYDAKPIAGLVPYDTELMIYENMLYCPADIAPLKERLRLMLQDNARLRHSLLTAREAIILADKHGLDGRKARLCALLHDCAKAHGKSLWLLQKSLSFTPNADERENPFLIHARLGAIRARNEFRIRDEEILNAIKRHTLGCPEMTPFDKAIFLADKLEPTRDYRGIADLRELAYRDMDAAMIAVIKNNIEYNEQRGISIHPLTLETLAALERADGKASGAADDAKS